MSNNNLNKIKDLSSLTPKIKNFIDLSVLDNDYIDQVNNELLHQSSIPDRTTLNNTFTPNQNNKPSITLKVSKINLDDFECNHAFNDNLIDVFNFKDQDSENDKKEK